MEVQGFVLLCVPCAFCLCACRLKYRQCAVPKSVWQYAVNIAVARFYLCSCLSLWVLQFTAVNLQRKCTLWSVVLLAHVVVHKYHLLDSRCLRDLTQVPAVELPWLRNACFLTVMRVQRRSEFAQPTIESPSTSVVYWKCLHYRCLVCYPVVALLFTARCWPWCCRHFAAHV